MKECDAYNVALGMSCWNRSKSELVSFDFETVFNRRDAVDLAHAFLRHLLVEVAANRTAKNDMSLFRFAPQVLLGEVRIVINGVLHPVFQTNDGILHIPYFPVRRVASNFCPIHERPSKSICENIGEKKRPSERGNEN